MFTAGKFKRTVTVFGETTEEGKAKFQSDLESIHAAFKGHVNEQRGHALDIEQVATGEAWLALQVTHTQHPKGQKGTKQIKEGSPSPCR